MCPRREVSVPAHKGLCVHEEGSLCPHIGGQNDDGGWEVGRVVLNALPILPAAGDQPPHLDRGFQTTANYRQPQQTIANPPRREHGQGLRMKWATDEGG